MAAGWTVWGSNPGEGEIFLTCPDRPWGPRSLLYNGYRLFPGGKGGRGVTLTPHPILVPWSRKSRAIPLLPLWAVRPVQSLSACTRVYFTFTYMFRWLLLPSSGYVQKVCVHTRLTLNGVLKSWSKGKETDNKLILTYCIVFV